MQVVASRFKALLKSDRVIVAASGALTHDVSCLWEKFNGSVVQIVFKMGSLIYTKEQV
jgi:hypothetical protein